VFTDFFNAFMTSVYVQINTGTKGRLWRRRIRT